MLSKFKEVKADVSVAVDYGAKSLSYNRQYSMMGQNNEEDYREQCSFNGASTMEENKQLPRLPSSYCSSCCCLVAAAVAVAAVVLYE